MAQSPYRKPPDEAQSPRRHHRPLRRGLCLFALVLTLPFGWVRSQPSCAGDTSKTYSGFELLVASDKGQSLAIVLLLLVTPLALGFLVHREASAGKRVLADSIAALLALLGAAFLFFASTFEVFSHRELLLPGFLGVLAAAGMGLDAALEAARGAVELVRLRRAKRAIASVATLYENEQEVRIETKPSSRPPPLYTFDDDESSTMEGPEGGPPKPPRVAVADGEREAESSQEAEAEAQSEEEATSDHSPSKAPRS